MCYSPDLLQKNRGQGSDITGVLSDHKFYEQVDSKLSGWRRAELFCSVHQIGSFCLKSNIWGSQHCDIWRAFWAWWTRYWTKTFLRKKNNKVCSKNLSSVLSNWPKHNSAVNEHFLSSMIHLICSRAEKDYHNCNCTHQVLDQLIWVWTKCLK